MSHQEWPTLLAAVATTIAGFGLAMMGGIMPVLLLAVPVVVGVVLRPSFGAYLFLLANPLIVGIARGDVIPIVRPNELLLLLLLLAFALRLAGRMLSGKATGISGNAVDLMLLLMAIVGSLLPLAWRTLRSLPVSVDDLLYAVVLWKYLALYWFFRQSIATRHQVLMCLYASMSSGAIVAAVAMLQVSNLLGIPELLFLYYDAPFTGWEELVTDRGTSTIASSFGTADVMIMNLAIALALLRSVRWRSWRLGSATVLFLFGCLAAGAFSGFIGLAVALLSFGVIARHTGRVIMASLPIAGVGMIAFWPVIAGRLAGFERASGMPQSWEGRWANLRDYFLPEILSGTNWLTGVQPAARLPAAETWRDWIYIESGYVWLLWVGGIPLVLTFFAFVWICTRLLRQIAQDWQNPVGATAAATLSYLMVIVVLMLLDPHLTIRGSADLFFPLLAIALLRQRKHRLAYRSAESEHLKRAAGTHVDFQPPLAHHRSA